MATKEELQAQADAEIEAAKPLNKSVNGTTTWKDAIAQVKSDNPNPE